MADVIPGIPDGTRRQMEIYTAGLAGITPGQPVSVEALARKAKEELKPEAYDYLAGGAGSEDTMRANREAFRRWRIVPRLLRDVARRDLSVEVLGQKFPAPVMLAPIGVQGIFHKEGELPVARAARETGIPFILSTVSSNTMEDVAEAMGETPRWFQLYWPKSDALAASFVQRAERAGYGAIVVTLDTYLLSWRERDIQNAYLPFVRGEGLANYVSDPVFREEIGGNPALHPKKTLEHFGEVFSDPSRTWDHLPRLRAATGLPLILKGILHPDDARKAVDHGASGIIVSNHGGRQLDGALAALDALPGIVEAVGDRATVLYDSGIRRGADVLKAMALGARCVLLGRPYCYGLAVGGEKGVREVLMNLLADLDLTLGLAGCASFAELSRANLVEVAYPLGIAATEGQALDRQIDGSR
jgi:isopentenyl diphosphate isomerase/L-lactate dehydrogenase-like FMN-dependent dehydrogenase